MVEAAKRTDGLTLYPPMPTGDELTGLSQMKCAST
jgi:hypothetical protein